MTTLLSDLDLEVGPDHHFLVVPAVGKSCLLSRRVVSGLVVGLPDAHHSVLVAPAMLIDVSSLTRLFGPHSLVYHLPFGPLCPANVSYLPCMMLLCP